MFWCFVGIEAFTHLGEEFKHPRRDFPLALLLGVLLAGLVYWAFSVAVLSFDAYGERSDATSLPACCTGCSALRPLAGRGRRLPGLLRLDERLRAGLRPADLEPGRRGQAALRPGRAQPPRHAGTALLLVVLACALCAVGAALLQLSTDELIRYANGNFVLVYLLSMAAGVVLLRGVWRIVAALAGLLCAAVLAMLGHGCAVRARPARRAGAARRRTPTGHAVDLNPLRQGRRRALAGNGPALVTTLVAPLAPYRRIPKALRLTDK